MNIKCIAFALLLAACNSATTNTITKPLVTLAPNAVAVSKTSTQEVTNFALDPAQVIVFNTEVNQQSVEMTIAAINEKQNLNQDVYLILNSPGGDVFAGMLLISYIEGSKVKVNTVDFGLCASMCAQIFAHGAKRFMVDRTTLMYHLAAGGVQGTVQNMRSLLAYIDLSTQKLDAYAANRAGMDYATFESTVAKDLWLDAEDSIKLHLADGLVTIRIKGNDAAVINVSEEFKKKNIKQSDRYKNPLMGLE